MPSELALTPALSRKRERENCRPARRLLDGHRLRQIARLVDVGPAQHGDVIREHLQRHREHGRRDQVAAGCDLDDCAASPSGVIGTSVSANTNSSPPRARTSSRFDFSFSSSWSFGATVIDRHVGVDERERAVLQLAGRIRLGVDVRDFLELQRAFERDRVVHAAAEEQRVLLRRETLGELDRSRLEREHSADDARQVAQLVDEAARTSSAASAAQARELEREQRTARRAAS